MRPNNVKVCANSTIGEKGQHMKNKLDAYTFLNHARWHCLFGSNADNIERSPDLGDIEAARILNGLAMEVLREFRG